jgi:hypothetical protein
MEADHEQFDSLSDLFAVLAGKIGEVRADVRGDVTEYRRGDVRFATVDSSGADLRLLPDIAQAAARTPSTRPSERGPDWIRFAPPEIDEHVLDRARAWFQVAWRTAARG